MSKIITILHIPEPKIRKSQANATKKHADKSKYTRKTKHKNPECFLCAPVVKDGHASKNSDEPRDTLINDESSLSEAPFDFKSSEYSAC